MKRIAFIGIALASAGLLYLLFRPASLKPTPFVVGPARPPGQVTPQVVSTWGFAFLLAQDGTLWSWGGGERYFAPHLFGNTTVRETPVKVSDDTDWRRIAAAQTYVLALKRDGSLWAWGMNSSGVTGTNTLVPKPKRLGTDTNWLDISSGAGHAMALKRDGSAWAWGQNDHGQVGDGTKTGRFAPVQVGTDHDWKFISAGSFNSFAQKADGTLWGWGLSPMFPATTDVLAPKQIDPATNWVSIAAGDYFILGLKSDGTLWFRGQNDYVASKAVKNAKASMARVGSDSDWREVYAGSDFFFARKSDGSWWGCGRNDLGQLGLGLQGDVSGFNGSSIVTAPVKLPLQFEPWAFGAGGRSAVLLTKDGALWTWGLRLGAVKIDPYFTPFRSTINDLSRIMLHKQLFMSEAEKFDLTPRKIGTFDGRARH